MTNRPDKEKTMSKGVQLILHCC